MLEGLSKVRGLLARIETGPTADMNSCRYFDTTVNNVFLGIEIFHPMNFLI